MAHVGCPVLVENLDHRYFIFHMLIDLQLSIVDSFMQENSIQYSWNLI